eukprot:753777-Hanusia_phi.AAC.6
MLQIVDLSHPERALSSLIELRDLSCNPAKAEEIATHADLWDRIDSFARLPNQDLQRLTFTLVGNLAFYSEAGKAELMHRDFMRLLLDCGLHSDSVHVEVGKRRGLIRPDPSPHRPRPAKRWGGGARTTRRLRCISSPLAGWR